MADAAKGDRVPQTEPSENLAWLAGQNLEEFEGQWVAVVDCNLVKASYDLEDVIRTAEKRHPGRTPFVMRVSSEPITV